MQFLKTGERLDITNVCEDISWAEHENEYAMNISFSAYNAVMDGKYLMEIIKPNMQMFLYSNYDQGWTEVARGTLNVWKPEEGNDENVFGGEAYDMLYDLQKSQEYRYIAHGTDTKTAILSIFSDWNIPLGIYNGPTTTRHKKKIFKSSYIGDNITELLDDAIKQGEVKHFLRSREGVVDVIPQGTNETVYALKALENVTQVKSKISIQDIVTRVIILSKADDEGRHRQLVRIDRDIQYGIRQRIIIRNDENDLLEALLEADEILTEKGVPEEEYTLPNLPDIPPLRKGDIIYIHAATLNGYYFVTSITHYASKRSMTITVEKANTEPLYPKPDDPVDAEAIQHIEYLRRLQ